MIRNSTAPVPNIELLDKVLEFIDKHPDQWEQTVWLQRPFAEPKPEPEVTECGTAACLAGWTTLLSGYLPVFESASVWTSEYVVKASTLSEDTLAEASAKHVLTVADVMDDPNTDPDAYSMDRLCYVESAAQNLLGLTYDEASVLFYSNNQREDIARIVEAIKIRANGADLHDYQDPDRGRYFDLLNNAPRNGMEDY